MGVFDIFGGGRPAREEEINIDEFLSGMHRVDEDEARTWVEVTKLESADGVNSVVDNLEKDNIVVVDISPMFRDKEGLKKAINNLKNVCIEIDGDIGRVSTNQIIVVPEGMRVRKG